MKVFIPKCGQAAVLESDWTFNVIDERRNRSFVIEYRSLKPTFERAWMPDTIVTLKAGTELVFDRVYIRQDADEFASVTFIVKECERESLAGERFWVRLDDVNTMDVVWTSEDNPVGGFAKAKYKADYKARKDPSVDKKREARERARVELDAVRSHIRSVCSEARKGSHDMHEHVQSLETIVTNYYMSRGEHYYAAYVRYGMENSPYRRGSSDPWRVVKTVKLDDGTTVRHVRFFPTHWTQSDTTFPGSS